MKILDEKITVAANLAGSFRRYWYWWLILLATMVLDYLSTDAFVVKYGIEAEANLITRFMMARFGAEPGNLIGKILQFLAVLGMVGLSSRVGNFFMLFVVLINCWAIIMNTIG